ncbi:MAG: GreA/GreB family elongation factor [Pseudomonadota bacterium]
MGRWRPPQPKGSPYITAIGFERLQSELDDLWLRRRDVVAALSAAAAEGDRSENAEYIYRKKELGGIDRRIRFLQKRLPELTIVREMASGEHVFFGATVTVEDEQGIEKTVRIVGPDETDSKRGDISMDSPLAKALMKKSVDDEVSIVVEGDKTIWLITAVSYR